MFSRYLQGRDHRVAEHGDSMITRRFRMRQVVEAQASPLDRRPAHLARLPYEDRLRIDNDPPEKLLLVLYVDHEAGLSGAWLDPKVEIAWNRLYDFPDVAKICGRLAESHPTLCRQRPATSLQTTGSPTQLPAASQRSPSVHALASSQFVPAGTAS